MGHTSRAAVQCRQEVYKFRFFRFRQFLLLNCVQDSIRFCDAFFVLSFYDQRLQVSGESPSRVINMICMVIACSIRRNGKICTMILTINTALPDTRLYGTCQQYNDIQLGGQQWFFFTRISSKLIGSAHCLLPP